MAVECLRRSSGSRGPVTHSNALVRFKYYQIPFCSNNTIIYSQIRYNAVDIIENYLKNVALLST